MRISSVIVAFSKAIQNVFEEFKRNRLNDVAHMRKEINKINGIA